MKKTYLITTAFIVFLGLALQANSSTNASGKNGVPGEIPNRISNPFLTLTFDSASKSLTLIANPNHKTFLRNLIPENSTATIRKENVSSPVFGKGIALILNSSGASSVSFALYPSQPFLFVNQTIQNTGSEIMD